MSAFAALKALREASASPLDGGDTLDTPGVQRVVADIVKEEEVHKIQPELSTFHTVSNFSPNRQNIIFRDGNVLVALKKGESLIINGQCTFTVENGAVLINDIHYVSSSSSNSSHDFIATPAQSLPVISSTHHANKRNKPCAPSSDFSIEYESVVKLSNLYTGLEKLSYFHNSFKSFFYNKSQEQDGFLDSDIKRYSAKFKSYSFEIVLNQDEEFSGLTINPEWRSLISKAITECSKDKEPKVFMVIGTKNSGKSTFAKTLLNSLIQYSNKKRKKAENVKKISYIDVDPNQSVFSTPYSLSISNHDVPNFALNFHETLAPEDCYSHYYGFSTAQELPHRYLSIIKSLLHHYKENYKENGNHLVINTPGWVKGFGKELLKEVSRLVQPDQVFFLSNSLEESDDSLALEGISFQNISTSRGIYKTSKFTSSQLKTFNKLAYFHQSSCLKFNFESWFLEKSPLKLSYSTLNTQETLGINAITILNQDVQVNFHIDDLGLMLEASIVGIYAIEASLFQNFKPKLTNNNKNLDMPLYINSLDFTIDHNSPLIRYMGLSMVHSINAADRYLNMYFPFSNRIQGLIKEYIERKYKLIIVKGEGSLPVYEMVSPDMLLFSGSERLPQLPYVSFDNRSKVGDVWKIRRNVMRNRKN